MADRDPIRLGIIGAGAISQVVHLPIFTEREDVDLLAIADTDVHKAETLSRRFGVPYVMEADELLGMDELDAIVLCTPNHLHEEMTIAALESGRDVLVERPLALTSEGTARVVNAAEKAGQVLVVGMPHRFRPEAIALRSFVEGGELGDLYAMRASWLTRSYTLTRSTWRNDRAEAGGGALIDLGIPALDLCLWTTGFPEVKRISCITAAEGDGVEHAATLMIETEGGVAISIEVGNRFFAGDDRYYLRVMGLEGSASIPPLEVFKQLGGRPMDVTPRQPRPQGGENPYMNAYRRLLDDFVRRVAGIGDTTIPREQVKLFSLIEAAYRSAESGHEVEL